jgi:hypothetical protein
MKKLEAESEKEHLNAMTVLIDDLWEEYSCEENLTKQAAKKFF